MSARPGLAPSGGFEPLAFTALDDAEGLARAEAFRAAMRRRRTVRDFSPRPVPRAVIEAAVMTAASAPSGANQQPWTFACIADPAVKARIRAAAEAEEREFYEHRAGPDWLAALAPLGTDWRKPFLDVAPWLIVVFAQRHGIGPTGRRVKHYALTDPMEFFAEMTEAYFGANDFFPFTRAELKESEPEIYDLLGIIWEGKEKR